MRCDEEPPPPVTYHSVMAAASASMHPGKRGPVQRWSVLLIASWARGVSGTGERARGPLKITRSEGGKFPACPSFDLLDGSASLRVGPTRID